MEEKYSVKNGRIEAVMWIVYRDLKFVVEKRPFHPTKATTCLPAGHIDLNVDLQRSDRSAKAYIENAFLRESQEEFLEGGFKPKKWEYLKAIDFEEKERDGSITKLRLHYFLITDWSGEVPKHTVENGGKHADLLWFSLYDYKKLLQTCDREALRFVMKQKNLVEMVTEVDVDDTVIGERPIFDFPNSNHIHRAAHLFLFNSKGELLIQKRPKNKRVYPDVWDDSCAGYVSSGETYEDCVQKECFEELRIKLKDYKQIFHYHWFDAVDKSHKEVFTAVYDGEIHRDKDEVAAVKWVDMSALREDMLKNPEKFTPTFKEGLRIYLNC